VGDLDNDGWSDLVISHSNSLVRVLKNAGSGSSLHHWSGFHLVGRNNRPIAGATLTVQAGDRTLTRFVKSGGSYLSTSDPRVLVGLGNDGQKVSVTVKWPWGETQRWSDLEVDRYWELKEDNPDAVAISRQAP
jgi:hypothetical protein